MKYALRTVLLLNTCEHWSHWAMSPRKHLLVTSLLEMKLDHVTMFEWQQHTQHYTDVQDYQEVLDFLNLRAQAA